MFDITRRRAGITAAAFAITITAAACGNQQAPATDITAPGAPATTERAQPAPERHEGHPTTPDAAERRAQPPGEAGRRIPDARP